MSTERDVVDLREKTIFHSFSEKNTINAKKSCKYLLQKKLLLNDVSQRKSIRQPIHVYMCVCVFTQHNLYIQYNIIKKKR